MSIFPLSQLIWTNSHLKPRFVNILFDIVKCSSCVLWLHFYSLYWKLPIVKITFRLLFIAYIDLQSVLVVDVVNNSVTTFQFYAIIWRANISKAQLFGLDFVNKIYFHCVRTYKKHVHTRKCNKNSISSRQHFSICLRFLYSLQLT